MAAAGTVAVLLPGAFYFIRETQKPPVELFRQHGVPMAVATDCNPGTSPLTSLLLAMNMAATLFRLTVDECLAGVTREAARALGMLDEIGTLEAGKCRRPRDLGHRAPGRARLPHGLQPAPRPHLEGPMTAIVLEARRRARSRLARDLLAARCRRSIRPAAAVVAGERGGRGAHRRQGRAGLRHQHRLRQARQRAHRGPPISRRCSATSCCRMPPASGEPMPVPVVRLMMALKLASLAQGASGVRPATLALLEAMLAQGVIPVVPAQGSVGASGDLAPLAHMTAAMIGVGEAFTPAGRLPAAEALAAAGLAPVVLGPKEGLALLNGTQFSTAYALAGLFEAETLLQAALVTGALSTDAARGSDAPFDPRIHALRRHAARSRRPPRCARCMAGSADPRLASRRRRARAGSLLPALPAAGDGRRARPAAPGRGDCSAPRRTASPTIR